MLHTQIPDGWQQGRGAYGGLVVATLVGALTDGDAPLRSLHAVLCGPVVPGAAEIAVSDLRIGSGTTFREARLLQGGAVLASTLAVFGRDRPAHLDSRAIAMPDVVAYADAAVAPIGPPVAPVFTQHFEFRPAAGPLPFSGSGHTRCAAWVRLKSRGHFADAALAAMLVDAMWPVMSLAMTAPRPIATVAFTMQMVDGFAHPDAPALLAISSDVVHDGYSVESRELWGEDGRLIARNQQTIALIA